MSVIITEMDMPKSCEECPYCKGENNSCLKGCHIPWRAFDNSKYLHKDCPLKPIDGLIKEIKNIDLDKTTNNFYGMQKKVIKVVKEYCEVKE